MSQKNTYEDSKKIQNFIAYADGCLDLVEISEKIQQSAIPMIPVIEQLISEEIIEIISM